MKKKIIIIIICCICGLILLSVMPYNVQTVSNALVNSENGDIAFVYDMQKMSFTLGVLVLCDKDGNVLFQESFQDSGKVSIRLAFCGENIYAYTGIGERLYGFDRNGKPLSQYEISASDIKNKMHFYGWSSGFIDATYVLGEYVYRYERPLFFKKTSRLVIEHNGETVVLFEGR